MSLAHRLAGVLALAAGLAACRGQDYWMDRLQADPLHQSAEKLRLSAACAALVPMEFGQTFPVPVRGGADQFKVLFYPVVTSPSPAQAMTPLFEGRFGRGTAEGGSCARLDSGQARPMGPAVPAGLSMTAYYREGARLFASLGRASELYSQGAAPSAQDKRALADCADAYMTMAEPGLLPYYYRLNPDFWEWLRQQGGRSLPKPQG